MLHRRTEQLHKAAHGLDALALSDVASILAQAQAEAVSATAPVAPNLAAAGQAMAAAIREGHQLHYAAAGSSGLMAMADACELSGTFGIDPARIAIHMAGGVPVDASMPGDTEDDVDAARVAAGQMSRGDCAIVISASGSTPYAVDIARRAQRVGAVTVCLSNTKASPLLEGADIAIHLATPPEVLAGSTRLGAGTAQKVALNTMSTVMGVALGHVHDGLMVNVIADNKKLRARATGIISTISGVDAGRAAECLAAAGGEVKPAVLLASGAADLNDAKDRLSRANGILRPILADLMGRH